MKKFYFNSTVKILVISFVFVALGLIGPNTVNAATSPSLGAAANFSVLAGLSMSAAGAGTTVTGNLGLSPGLAVSRTGPWTVGGIEYFGTGGLSQTAQTDALGAFNNLAGQGSDGGWGISPWSPTPGVYTVALDTTFTGTITLNGGYNDVWVFQVGQDLVFSGSVVLTGNAQPCHVFWQVGRDATIALGSSFVGTLIASRDITLVSGATVNGRIMSLNSSLTTDGNTISGPTCTAAPPATSTIAVVKTVINDNGGTKVAANFPLFVNGTPVVNGVATTFPAGSGYAVTETGDANYNQAFSGDCDAAGHLDIIAGDNKACIITNNDRPAATGGSGGSAFVPAVPPLIDVVKVPNPLALPGGPGPVTYTYTLRNIGTVPVTDITMVGDTCSPITLVSGDTNSDAKLDVNETWIYNCTTNLSVTHTNIVTAMGWANGISATDIANATVVVGTPVVPPLIHVTKVPSPLTLPAGGGLVTYTKRVTNPGTVALSNVRLADDKCASIKYVSGDTNGDSKLDTTETWIYTCQTNLTQTTLNTVTAKGDANGLTATDYAVATVVVAGVVPTLPNTGFPPANNISWIIIVLAGVIILASASVFVFLKKRTI